MDKMIGMIRWIQNMKAMFVPIFLLLPLFAIGCGGSRFERENLEYGRTEIEPQIAAKVADTTNLADQIGGLLVTNDADLAGEWVKSVHDDGIRLTLRKKRDGRYDVTFRADGDLERWTLRRNASFVGGVLEFDRPVAGYVPFDPYTHCYLIRTLIGDRLVMQPDARFWLIEKKAWRWPQRVWDVMKDRGPFLKKEESSPSQGDTVIIP